uniref:Uncharacterized protein n=1 Tax=Acrobeloides nanus TaxID=290746 RepID=A0A914E096_9BILA
MKNQLRWSCGMSRAIIIASIIIGGAPSLAEIVQEFSNADKDGTKENSGSEVMEIDEEESEVEEQAITSLDTKSYEIVRRYMEKNFDKLVLLSYSDGLDNP